jgi:DNA polymerase III epsilon subunit family exonuclease
MTVDLFSSLPNPLLARPFAVVDFETTGLYPAMGDEICEVGLARVEKGEIVKEYSALVDPGRPLDPAAAQVSGITPEMLAGTPKFEALADEFLPLFEGAVIVAHNAEFDMAFLQYKLVRMQRQQLDNPVIDTLEMARAQDDSGPYTLGILANRLGIEGPHAHRALDDARMAARVLLHYLAEYHKRGQDELSRLPGFRNSYQFSIQGRERGEENSFQTVVESIRKAIESKTDLEISYVGGKAASRRRVTPWQIKGMNLRAWCHLRKEERDFRLDRILEVHEVVEEGKR